MGFTKNGCGMKMLKTWRTKEMLIEMDEGELRSLEKCFMWEEMMKWRRKIKDEKPLITFSQDHAYWTQTALLSRPCLLVADTSFCQDHACWSQTPLLLRPCLLVIDASFCQDHACWSQTHPFVKTMPIGRRRLFLSRSCLLVTNAPFYQDHACWSQVPLFVKIMPMLEICICAAK